MSGVSSEGKCMERSPGDEPLTLTICHSYMKPLKGGSPSGAEPCNLKGIKRKISVVLLFLKFCFSFTIAHLMA